MKSAFHMPSMALGYCGKNSLEFVNQYFSRPRGDSYVNGKRR
ncbi:hypothetical protein CSC43_6004 [Pseudomonas aeruginosa]|nr:hypothetical protein CSC43_6004 [Pseudomonas aeruginosa]